MNKNEILNTFQWSTQHKVYVLWKYKLLSVFSLFENFKFKFTPDNQNKSAKGKFKTPNWPVETETMYNRIWSYRQMENTEKDYSVRFLSDMWNSSAHKNWTNGAKLRYHYL